MSFSSKVKKELAGHISNATHCRIAEIAAIISMCGSVLIDVDEKYSIRVRTETDSTAEKFKTLVWKTFHIDAKIIVKKNAYSKNAETYTITIKDHNQAMKVLEATKLIDDQGQIGENLSVTNNVVIMKDCCKRAFIRGAFMAAGSISDPNSSYHFEIKCNNEKKAEQLIKLLNKFNIEAKTVARKGHFVVYIKEGATTSSITISWTASEGATSYEIVRFVNNNEYVVGSTTSTTYTVDGFNNKLKNDTYVGVRPVRTVNGFSAKTTGFYNTEYLSPYKINLVPEKVQGLAITNYYNSLKEVTFGFTQPEYHDGYVYELYTYKKKKGSSGNLSSISYNTLKNIKNQFYKLRVRAYVTIDNKNYYGAWSDYTVFALQPKVGLKKSGKKLKITWKKVSGAKNYTVYMSTSKTGGYKKLTTTKKRAYTAKKFKKKKLNKKKTYYVYVVANRKEGKKTYKSKAVNCYYLY